MGITSTIKSLVATAPEDRDLIECLEAEHDEFKELLKKLEDSSDKATELRKKTFRRLQALLTAHSKAEAAVLYTQIQKKKLTKDITLEGYEEHEVADFMVKRISNTKYNDPTFRAKVIVLRESLEHHIKEEEKDMFKKVREIFDEEELMDMKLDYEKRRDRIMARHEA